MIEMMHYERFNNRAKQVYQTRRSSLNNSNRFGSLKVDTNDSLSEVIFSAKYL